MIVKRIYLSSYTNRQGTITVIQLLILTSIIMFGFTSIDNVKTTGYCPGPPCVDLKWADGITAAGTKAHVGVCAADWSVFPKGSIFDIPGYGKCRVEDTGRAVKGKHLDLYFDTAYEARQWGVKTISVYYLGNEEIN